MAQVFLLSDSILDIGGDTTQEGDRCSRKDFIILSEVYVTISLTPSS